MPEEVFSPVPRRELFARSVERYAVQCAKEYVLPAFSGDAEAAFSLSCRLTNEQRGHVAVAMWEARVAKPAFRRFLESVWNHDHRYVIAAARTRPRLASMFRYADFDAPDGLAGPIRLWRGTSGVPMARARKGYSWTTDRDTACWFAMCHAARRGIPLVLSTEVDAGKVALFCNEREEHEAVLTVTPSRVEVDGAPDDWAAGFTRVNERIKKGEQMRLALLRARSDGQQQADLLIALPL
jgi:hypothetical protein